MGTPGLGLSWLGPSSRLGFNKSKAFFKDNYLGISVLDKHFERKRREVFSFRKSDGNTIIIGNYRKLYSGTIKKSLNNLDKSES